MYCLYSSSAICMYRPHFYACGLFLNMVNCTRPMNKKSNTEQNRTLDSVNYHHSPTNLCTWHYIQTRINSKCIINTHPPPLLSYHCMRWSKPSAPPPPKADKYMPLFEVEHPIYSLYQCSWKFCIHRVYRINTHPPMEMQHVFCEL